jgi:acyl-CoA synthetase (AMP-forming)/AMP-acid ligase II
VDCDSGGLQPGARIAVFLEASIPQVLAISPPARADPSLCHSPAFRPGQVVTNIERLRSSGVGHVRARLDSLADVLDQLTNLAFVVTTDGDCASSFPIPVHRFEDLSRTPVPIEEESGSDLELAAILYTSGSTGKPNGVMLSHAQIMAGASIVSEYLNLNERDRILAVLPFSFDAGLNQLMTSVHVGGTLVLLNFVFAREIVDALVREKITGLAGVPTLWNLLTHPHARLEHTPLPHLRYITSTGGTMPQRVLSVLRRTLTRTRIFLMYGFTEAFRSTYLPPEELDRRPTSIGKAIPLTELFIVNESGEACAVGKVGELVHRGPTVALGYWGNPELTRSKFRPHPFPKADADPHERVCYSGDLVKADDEGYFYFVGRNDTMIKSAGFRISPTEVEEVLQQCEGVRLAAVIGIPDEVAGQSIRAFVVRASADIIASTLLHCCSRQLPTHMLPQEIEFVDNLPMTPNGKVDYQELRRLIS